MYSLVHGTGKYILTDFKVMAGCRINLCYAELVIARSYRLTVCGRPIVRSNGCETIVLRLIVGITWV